MKNRITRKFLCAVLPVLLGPFAAATAQTDAECMKGYRDTTDVERATMTAVLEAVRDALPDAPEGWVILGDDALSVPRSICLDSALWTYRHTRYYQRVDDQEEQEALMQASGETLKADMAAKQPRLDAIMARNIELSKAVGVAAQAGDYARVTEINAEIEAGSQEYQNILAEGGAQERVNAELEESARDRNMKVSAEINVGGVSIDGRESLAVPAGASAAYLWRPDDPDKPINALVLLGRWMPADFGLHMLHHEGVAPESAQAISVTVEVAASRLPSAIDATDFEALATLLQE
jgi:hypothetical protein